MKRLISLLFVSFFCFIYGFCQNVILTRNESLAYRKLEITALKITLAVYGDSITNMLRGEIPFPGPICISFFQNHIDKIEFYEKYGKWTEALKEKFRKEIKKHIFYASADPYMSTDNFRKLWAKEGGSAYPFSLHTNYLVLCPQRHSKVCFELLKTFRVTLENKCRFSSKVRKSGNMCIVSPS